MKKEFFDKIIEIMKKNKDIYFIAAGLGWPRTDELQMKFPDRYINTEAAEQTAMDIAVGLAYAEKIPFVYTITPFFLRGFETIRTYIAHEKLNVKLVGVGRDNDYSKHDGWSHEAGDIPIILKVFPEIIQFIPDDVDLMKKDIDKMVRLKGPAFISIRR